MIKVEQTPSTENNKIHSAKLDSVLQTIDDNEVLLTLDSKEHEVVIVMV